ncbi:MAG: FUSC family protein [Terriglobia bacterium]
MARIRSLIPSRLNRQSLEHSARTTLAAVISLLVARALKLPEAYWAPITTLVVTQSSTVGAALPISAQRFAGTALGAVMGAFLATLFGPGMVAFGVGVLLAGMICVLLRLERSAYRFTGITIAIVVLVARASPPWIIAVHRFVEVSIGIAVGLGITALWPERPQVAGQSPNQ